MTRWFVKPILMVTDKLTMKNSSLWWLQSKNESPIPLNMRNIIKMPYFNKFCTFKKYSRISFLFFRSKFFEWSNFAIEILWFTPKMTLKNWPSTDGYRVKIYSNFSKISFRNFFMKFFMVPKEWYSTVYLYCLYRNKACHQIVQ